MLDLYNKVCNDCSALITKQYSTSFSLGIKLFDKSLRVPIYGIYGFVRFADEIVDTFDKTDQKYLLDKFEADTYEAIKMGISLNPVLHSFQEVVNKYEIEHDLIDAFLKSMKMDLNYQVYGEKLYKEYIFGSAEVVGLMCLKVFVQGDQENYERLRPYACSLGSAFQKINFLRDIKSDYFDRGRVYFPGVDFVNFEEKDKIAIENDIKADFDHAAIGISKLPAEAKLGVHLAYTYYLNLFKKIKNAQACEIAKQRFRVRDSRKVYLLFSSALRNRLNLL
jgi:15-cis-phytoene synthase